jgi:hypothetical protein
VVPLEQVKAYLVLQNWANFFSNLIIFFPKKPDIALDFKASLTYLFSFIPIKGLDTG